MELYCEIGKAVCRRMEKGAAVMASEYLNEQYPDVKGFSPRSLRRMRNFYRTYEDQPAMLSLVMQIGWIQNMVIMEAALTMDLREWYIKAAEQFAWSKTELIANIADNAHDKLDHSVKTDIGWLYHQTSRTRNVCKGSKGYYRELLQRHCGMCNKGTKRRWASTTFVLCTVEHLYMLGMIQKNSYFRCINLQHKTPFKNTITI